MSGATDSRLQDYLKSLFPFDWELVRHAGAEPVPYHLKKWWFCLGGTPMYLFVVQVLTGIALAFYYVPSPEEAYASVAMITRELSFGWYIRSLHKWSGNLMIVAVFLHLLRVYFSGAYRHPRQLNWCIGLGLLGTTLAFGFTGYSLIYEQMSFWGATVAANLAEAVPLAGPYLAHFLRGGPQIGENTLTRFFILHIGVLPTAVFVLLGLHITLVRMHGVTELHFEGEKVAREERFFRFWPEHITTELLIGVLLMYLLTVLALIFPAGLGEPADPTQTPPHIKLRGLPCPTTYGSNEKTAPRGPDRSKARASASSRSRSGRVRRPPASAWPSMLCASFPRAGPGRSFASV